MGEAKVFYLATIFTASSSEFKRPIQAF